MVFRAFDDSGESENRKCASWKQKQQSSNIKVLSYSTCSDSSVLRRGEEVALRDSDGGQSQYAHHDQVDEAGLRGAVEGVVQPGDERAHDQEGDPTVVQPGHTDTKSGL